MSEVIDDGRNPLWRNDSTALALWEAVIEHGPLSGPGVGRLCLALDTLAAAERLETAITNGEFGVARDELIAYREVRQARAVAAAEVARLTGNAAIAPPVNRSSTATASTPTKGDPVMRFRPIQPAAGPTVALHAFSGMKPDGPSSADTSRPLVIRARSARITRPSRTSTPNDGTVRNA